jgi:hypothetical protein
MKEWHHSAVLYLPLDWKNRRVEFHAMGTERRVEMIGLLSRWPLRGLGDFFAETSCLFQLLLEHSKLATEQISLETTRLISSVLAFDMQKIEPRMPQRLNSLTSIERQRLRGTVGSYWQIIYQEKRRF